MKTTTTIIIMVIIILTLKEGHKNDTGLTFNILSRVRSRMASVVFIIISMTLKLFCFLLF